jgi:hypothetical protein
LIVADKETIVDKNTTTKLSHNLMSSNYYLIGLKREKLLELI